MSRVLLMVAAATLFLATDCLAFGSKFKDEVTKEAAAIKLMREAQEGGYKVLSTEELKGAIDGGEEMVLIDTMPFEASYKKAHIPGAQQFLFPIPTMKEWDEKETDGRSQEEFVAMLGDDKARKIVIYCGFVKCTRSHNGALWAVKLGYTNVYRHPGGIYAWKGAGYPVAEVE